MSELLFDTEFLAQLEQLRINYRTRAFGQSGGGRRSRMHGMSAEFSDFREYQLGDDFRRIDWNAFARFEKLVMKLFLEEKQMRVNFLIDQSASMSYFGKDIMAKRLALAMSYLALNGYDQVRVVPLGDENQREIGSLTGKNSFMRLMDYLQNMQPQKLSPLNEAITNINFKSGSGICYLLTDAFSQDGENADDAISGIENALAYLRYQKQETTLIHILAPQELNPKYEGEVRLIDSETGESREVEVNGSLLRLYEESLKTFCAKLKENCHKYGFQYELIPADMDLRKAILENII